MVKNLWQEVRSIIVPRGYVVSWETFRGNQLKQINKYGRFVDKRITTEDVLILERKRPLRTRTPEIFYKFILSSRITLIFENIQ